MTVTQKIPIASEALTRLTAEQRAGPCAVVIFGGAGDLATRKLLPALFECHQRHAMPPGCSIIGVGLPTLSTEAYRELIRRHLEKSARSRTINERSLNDFLQQSYYVAGTFDDPDVYDAVDRLARRLSDEREIPDNRLYYYAVPPTVFALISRNLSAHGMAQTKGPHHWRRVIVEKPFGHDLESARELNSELEKVFREWQIYRIDHYLAKEPVQNIMALRFANGIFEPLWNRNHIDHVQITVGETLGVEKRGRYFEQAGALRDVVQNHLMQLLALVAMEAPPSFDANAVRDEHAKVLRSVRPIPANRVDEYVIRGQYTDGVVKGRKVKGYRSEAGVDPESMTETYVAAKLLIDNWRWAEVPFYIRTGKRLRRNLTEIAIAFKQSPHLLFRRKMNGGCAYNTLVLQIQPQESIVLTFEAKIPGQDRALKSVDMHFHYEEAFGGIDADPYARLIRDCMNGDATLFMRKDSIEVAWWLMDSILQYWRSDSALSPASYSAGTLGPEEASFLLDRDGRRWRGL